MFSLEEIGEEIVVPLDFPFGGMFPDKSPSYMKDQDLSCI